MVTLMVEVNRIIISEREQVTFKLRTEDKKKIKKVREEHFRKQQAQ